MPSLSLCLSVCLPPLSLSPPPPPPPVQQQRPQLQYIVTLSFRDICSKGSCSKGSHFKKKSSSTACHPGTDRTAGYQTRGRSCTWLHVCNSFHLASRAQSVFPDWHVSACPISDHCPSDGEALRSGITMAVHCLSNKRLVFQFPNGWGNEPTMPAWTHHPQEPLGHHSPRNFSLAFRGGRDD